MSKRSLAPFFLEEDAFINDVTTREVLRVTGLDSEMNFLLLAKDEGIFSGRAWLEEFSDSLRWNKMAEEGQTLARGDALATGHAPASKILGVERTLLNGLQHLCGVATQANVYVKLAKKVAAEKHLPPPKILHTRKFFPGLRSYVLQALTAAGIETHRKTLADRVLIKDNHLLLVDQAGLSLQQFLKKMNPEFLQTGLFEADTEEQALIMVGAGVKHLMLDNFTIVRLQKFLPSLPSGVCIEISGGINLSTLVQFILPGVHRISVGSITHSVKAFDISLEMSVAES